MTLEQRLKTMLGEMQFTIAALQTQLELALAANQAPAKQDEPRDRELTVQPSQAIDGKPEGESSKR
jgi:hypothetical protein